ncbi:MAG: site-specific DNA-methyltransferase [Candidatus Nealsonbacteria bacterium]|nr:MAG: site-specific DNA-methyltransferase [Candidatus Nealsonbacteria bacterium]
MYDINEIVNKIHNMDCLEFMKNIPDKSIDLILTDPPYGINCSKGVWKGRRYSREYNDTWDNKRPAKEYFSEILRISKNTIIFGGNFFTDLLPQNNHWIVWDKTGEIKFNNPFSDCELIWTNIDKNTIKKYLCIQAGFIAKEKERYHPTQKPVELIECIIRDYTKKTDVILDCFLGSGTTAIACIRLNRRWIGCEIDPKYCKIAQERIDKEKRQLKLL